MRRTFATLLLALPLVGGCAMSFDATRLNVPVTMASASDAPAQGQAFKVNTTAVYTLWGAITLKEPALDKALATQLIGAKEVRDLRIKVKSSVPQIIFAVVTLGLVIPRSVTYEGVIPGEAAAAPAVTAPAAGAPAPR